MLTKLAHVVFAWDDPGIYLWIVLAILLLCLTLKAGVAESSKLRWWKLPLLVLLMLVPICGGINHFEPHDELYVVAWQGIIIWAAAAFMVAWYTVGWFYAETGWRRALMTLAVPTIMVLSYHLAYRIRSWVIESLA